MNHKAKRPRRSRAGCKMCKPHKTDRRSAHRWRDKRTDGPTYTTSSTAQVIQIEVDTRG
jgi:hypothetical protein